ncbi:hypothetical protein [Lewinella sp. 4G2]|uniref:hypothetical protein n=1 Tax=Lewinella sp. 4G2 TaxID=1803372 RepID=UPI0007B481D9|nr:hypothetical protein [Lewinella sp. 4G2]OAV42737.1 hypothetical protein A3850_015975 [Lewinella sp. 4G2]
MEPIKENKPSAKTFVAMSLVYFGLYFGLKYGVFGGDLPWYFNAALIGVCLVAALYLRNRASSTSE